tara:strand:+ start:9807 stop:10436 length:630 start_codon:yes stop_codon:yes gene_type:complete
MNDFLGQGMDLAEFLVRLQSTGELPFESTDPIGFVRTSTEHELKRMDERRKLEMAHAAPELDLDSAIWAAKQVARICQFLVYREIPAEQIDADLKPPCPSPKGPSQTYSVDLTMHWLPELLRRAHNIASADPMILPLQRLAWEWPLSSVGIGLQVGESDREPDLGPILESASLLQLYVDRIFTTNDETRLHHPTVAAAVSDAKGIWSGA